ncbi:MAG TPA: alkaline phosphatase family protein [Bryobacteraceae bacterium]|nr:alkaline phosphatase family protein [Bryobacteraceae bacterium]
MTPYLAYIGPGAGFAFMGSLLALVLSLFLSVISMLTWPFRAAWLALRRKRGYRNARVSKAIFLGLDGLDPLLTERFMAEGKLPNLSRLKEQGSYRRLRTTYPALSPVAWSTFATGVNPAKHNIFDFLNRDLRTYAPELSSSKVRPATRVLRFGRLRIPLERTTVEMRRKSEPFWKILGRHAIGCTILRVPITFPPDHFHGRLLSAMCTPDLRGAQGSFSWFSTTAGEAVRTGGNRYPLRREGNCLAGLLEGPQDSKPVSFRVKLNGKPDSGMLEIQGQTFPLLRGEYTPWIRLRFNGARGIARFLLTASHPEVSLYVTPIQIDPENPALPISQPRFYAAYLAKLLGSFATLGMAEDTWALNEGAIDEDAFLKQAESIQREREAMFFSALDRTRRGVVACVFDTSDRVQHMFFRYLDPARATPADGSHAETIERLYRDMDRLAGDTLRYVDDRTALFVLSDHGFRSFRRGVNLNSWLRRNGYLALNGDGTEGGDYFEGVDWSRTRAYALGLGGLYLNRRGRESGGIVPSEEAESLQRELAAKLSGLVDDDTGEVAVRQAYPAGELYSGPYLGAAPDLIIGYADGYRTSWDAAVGKVTVHVFEDNTKAWSGDHCIDPPLVPGVLFSNRRLDADEPGIEDLAPTVLRLFGVEPPKWMEGAPVFDLG